MIGRRFVGLAVCGASALVIGVGAVDAQPASATRSQEVAYRNSGDGTALTAALAMPDRGGPHPGVVVLTVAGPDRLVDRLVDDGFAVLLPVRRGFVAVEPLLRATYSDLAADARAALDYLASRPDVDGRSLALVAQADDAPPAMLAAVESETRMPLVLMAPPAFGGVETFRLEQRALAESLGARAADLAALDAYVDRIASIVLEERSPYRRELRLRDLRMSSAVQLPPSAAFPSDDRQMHFFASPLWHDRLAFEPETSLARLAFPVLVLVGTDDPRMPDDPYRSALRRGLSASASEDATVCLVEGRTRHAFTPDAVEAISVWLGSRRSGAAQPSVPLAGCLEEPDR